MTTLISPACRSKTAGNSPTDSCRVTILSKALGARSVLIGRDLCSGVWRWTASRALWLRWRCCWTNWTQPC